MGSKHRTPEQMLEHRARITQLHKEGWTNQDIAEELGIADYTVCRDIARVRTVLFKQAVENLDKARKQELAKINLIEREAWEQWERSKQPRTTKSATKGDTVNKQSFKEEERGGDPRYMEIIMRCSEQRAKLLGLIVNKIEGHVAIHNVQLVEVRPASEREQQTLLH